MTCGYSGISLITSFCLVFFGVDAVSDELPQPENLTLSWSPNRLSVTAQWNKPSGLDANCTVKYEISFSSENCSSDGQRKHEYRVTSLIYTWNVDDNEANDVCVQINTTPKQCGNKQPSKPLVQALSQPALVTNFTCVYYANMKMNCSWSLISNTSDLQLFYRSRDGNGFKPCVTYIGSRPMWTGCHLFGEEFVMKEYFFLINGTLEGVPIQSSFMRKIRDLVKTPPPKFNITRNGTHLVFQSSKPDFNPWCWEHEFYYSKCNEDEKTIIAKPSNWSVNVEYDEACRYTVRVKAVYISYCGKGGSEMSEPIYYGMDSNPNMAFIAAMVVIPIMVSCCLIAALVLFRRHKDSIFPEIPEPSLLYKDVIDGNDEKGKDVGNLYVPYEDAVEKKFSLVPASTVLHTGTQSLTPNNPLNPMV